MACGSASSGETPGGKDLILALNQATHDAGGTSVAEDLKGEAAITRATDAGGFGFDAQWDGFGYDVAKVVVPYADDGRDMGLIQGALQGSYNGDGFALYELVP
jgi:1,4-alpha-glucan branching enzyme